MTNVPPKMRIATRLLPLLAMVSACAIGGEDTTEPTLESLLSGTASISLVGSSSRVSLTTDNEWSLSKTGSLSGNTVTWNITATKTATTSGHLVVQGTMTVTNTGSGPATIGNIVVNLQRRVGNSWVTTASDIANATQGDDATTANIHKAASSENKPMFEENDASGSLNFMDATNNTLFSLVPQVLIGAGQTRTLLFSASFDNNDAALKLTPGTPIRAEVIVTFGNATQNGNSTANIDINGNGTIDGDEARVRSVPSRLGLTIPAAVNGNGNGNVTLSDTIADISKTGDVTFSNVTFNLGATSGTVTANVSGGANGGSITNCAHLTSADQTVTSGGFTFPLVGGLNLQDCSTVNVDGTPTCTSGVGNCGWQPGDLVTFDQTQWGTTSTTATALLSSSFGSVYFAAPNNGVLDVGIAGAGGFSIRLSSATAVVSYLPSAGNPAPLTADTSNPTTTSSGSLGGQVTALALNVDFSAAGLLGGSVTTDFGALTICGVTGVPTMTVGTFLAVAENTLGGANNGYSPTTIALVSQDLNSAFRDGSPSDFAQDHLVIGACP